MTKLGKNYKPVTRNGKTVIEIDRKAAISKLPVNKQIAARANAEKPKVASRAKAMSVKGAVS